MIVESHFWFVCTYNNHTYRCFWICPIFQNMWVCIQETNVHSYILRVGLIMMSKWIHLPRTCLFLLKLLFPCFPNVSMYNRFSFQLYIYAHFFTCFFPISHNYIVHICYVWKQWMYTCNYVYMQLIFNYNLPFSLKKL